MQPSWSSNNLVVQLRHVGDPLSDAVVRFLDLKTGEDGLARLLKYVEENPEDEWDHEVALFWRSIRDVPPVNIHALDQTSSYNEVKESWNIDLIKLIEDEDRQSQAETVAKPKETSANPATTGVFTPTEAIQSRNRRPPPTLSEGQAVFWRYSADMFDALGHFSLAGGETRRSGSVVHIPMLTVLSGFASARVMPVLYETGYLTSPSRDAIYRRLNETGQALIDFMSDMTPITGSGWKSCIRVRMLHSQVRIRILAQKTRLKKYDVERDGIPINQEDMAATLCGFGLAPLWCERRLGIHLSPEEELAFISCWRHIGYYLGIHPVLLRNFFTVAPPGHGRVSTTRPHRFFASVAFHLFAGTQKPKDPFATSTSKILHAIAHRPPTGKSAGFHCELSRMLLGYGLADQLGVPCGTLRDRLKVQQHAWTSWLQTTFGRYYRPQWEISKQLLLKRMITLVVTWQLGEKRSTYTWRDHQHHESKISDMMKDHAEAGEDSGLEFGMHIAKEVKWQAQRTFIEMGCVIALGAILSVVAATKAAGTAAHLYQNLR